jgi:retron-type reverse transcriptase
MAVGKASHRAKGVRNSGLGRHDEVCVMQTAEHILQAMRRLGEKGLPLTRVYRCLYSEDLLLKAYDKIGRNRGALTPGTVEDTADGMSLKRLRGVIEMLRNERFHFRPSRRMHIPKKKGGTRPLGVPNFTEKLVQEALRLLLDAYYEPQFRDSSHGFRPGRGCHSALTTVKHHFRGSAWFIEGDIRGCFDHIDHDELLAILARDIHDGRLLNSFGDVCRQAIWRIGTIISPTPVHPREAF